MLFDKFVQYLERIENTSSRNEMTKILSQLVQKLSARDSREAAYLIQGRIAPVFEPLEFNIAEKMMLRALSVTFNISEQNIQNEFHEIGDMGTLAQKYRERLQKPYKDIDVELVYERLHDIAMFSGRGSQDKKILGIRDLLEDLDPLGCRYVARVLVSKLRLGVSSKTMLDAISWAESGDKSLRKDIERAYYACSDLGLVMETYKDSGLPGLDKLQSRPGVPVFSKLVERIPTTEKIIEKMGPVFAQPKFDGLRCQIHKWEENGFVNVKLFSRNLEDMTEMFPDVVESVRGLEAKSFILDSEVIGYNTETEEFVPFQKTMYRKRKYGVTEKVAAIPVNVFVFDIMYLNGVEIMSESSANRIELLRKLVGGSENQIKLTETLKFSDPEKLEKYFMENVSEGLEGIIVKRIGSIYEPGTRNFEWVKLKRAMKGHLSDTVDVVIMGYYSGRGRLAKFGIGAILVGVLDKETDRYVTIAKVGTGITDDLWKEIATTLIPLVVDERPNSYVVDKMLIPDHWVIPDIVSEIRADEITRSPVHTCARDKEGVGYALRFPRMEAFIRDKSPEDCTSVKEVLGLYDAQVTPK